MTLPASGELSFSDIVTEFGGSAPHSLSEYYRGGSYVGSGAPNVPTSGQISFNDFYGAKAAFVFTATISSNTNNYNVQTAMVAAGWNGIDPFIATITINSGVIVGSTSTGSYAFTATSSFPTGSSLSITNNGTIQGMGGAGGAGGPASCNTGGYSGYAGGPALSISCPVTFNNTNGSILGGGGGGAGGGGARGVDSNWAHEARAGGGGGGGGRGTNGGAGGAGGSADGWVGGAAGSAGTSSAGGAYGAGGTKTTEDKNGYGTATGGRGGAGGAAGSSGGTGTAGAYNCGPNPPGPEVETPPGSVGAGGAAVVGNSNITWNGTGIRLGSIS